MAGILPAQANPQLAPAAKSAKQFSTFISIVANATGIDQRVLAAWIAAEGGPDKVPAGNPLNIMATGAHHGVANFGSQTAAAKATVALLMGNPAYKPILRAAKSGSPSDQIDAIAASPWDANHYRGASKTPGSLLRGTYSGAYGIAPGKGIPGAASDATNAVTGAVTGPVADAVSGVESWLQEKAPVAFLYVSLTLLALVLLALGVSRATGVSPLAAAGPTGAALAAGRRRVRPAKPGSPDYFSDLAMSG